MFFFGLILTVTALQYVGFWLAYTLPTIVFMLCPIILMIGRNRYIRSPPTGSVLSAALRLWWFAAKGRWSWNPVRLWKNLTASDFWDSAKPSRLAVKPSWMTFDDNWVDEVGRGFAACGVFLWYPVYCKRLAFPSCGVCLTVMNRADV